MSGCTHSAAGNVVMETVTWRANSAEGITFTRQELKESEHSLRSVCLCVGVTEESVSTSVLTAWGQSTALDTTDHTLYRQTRPVLRLLCRHIYHNSDHSLLLNIKPITRLINRITCSSFFIIFFFFFLSFFCYNFLCIAMRTNASMPTTFGWTEAKNLITYISVWVLDELRRSTWVYSRRWN